MFKSIFIIHYMLLIVSNFIWMFLEVISGILTNSIASAWIIEHPMMREVCITISVSTSLWSSSNVRNLHLFLFVITLRWNIVIGHKKTSKLHIFLKPHFVKIVSLVHIFWCHISNTNLPRPKTESTTIHCKDNTLRKAIGKSI